VLALLYDISPQFDIWKQVPLGTTGRRERLSQGQVPYPRPRYYLENEKGGVSGHLHVGNIVVIVYSEEEKGGREVCRSGIVARRDRRWYCFPFAIPA
jgi:hypothetical protein